MPTSAEPIMPPSTEGGWPTEPMVFTTPSTAATIPKAGRAPARRASAATGAWASWWWVSISLSISASISWELRLPDTIMRR
ncbi:hypothetical protein D3C72_2063620 [compost metagenome]